VCSAVKCTRHRVARVGLRTAPSSHGQSESRTERGSEDRSDARTRRHTQPRRGARW
jgi:hypothetical protein